MNMPRTLSHIAICGLLCGLILATTSTSRAEEVKPQGVNDYAKQIANALTDLDAGKTAEALKKLEATDKTLRSFEFDFLLARATNAKGGAADFIRTIAVPKVETRYGLLNPVDRQLAFICRDGGVRIFDLKAPDAPAKEVFHKDGGAIWSGAFSHDGATFVAGHENGDVVVWDVKTWKVRTIVPMGEKWPVRELAVAPDGKLFVAEAKTALQLWSLTEEKPKLVAAVGDRLNFGEGLAFSPKGDQIATGGMFDIHFHNAKTGEKTKSIRHASYTMGLEFSPDGTRIASAPRGNVNKFLSVFSIANSQSLFNAGPLTNYVAGLAFTPDGKRVIATGPNKDVRLFDSTTGDVVLTLSRPNHTAKPAITHDGQLLGWSENGVYCVIDIGKK